MPGRRIASLIASCGLVLAGCATDVERGRYLCDPSVDAGTPLADAQCPGAARCGLEGYCHNSGDTSVAWRCRDRNDCENGYECGLSRDHSFRECHDPEATDAGYPCEADGDCVRGWHCGVKQLCYDRSAKQPFPCASNADCADGWRCGRDAFCHDQQVADAYPCVEDDDCELGWRCGLAGRCLDPAVDALRPVTTALGDATKVNPLLLDHAPALIAASPVQSPTFNRPRQFIAYFDQGTVGVLNLAIGETPPIGTNPHALQELTDAGEVTSIATLGALSLNRLGQRDLGSWSYVTYTDGGSREIHFRTTPSPMNFDGNPTRALYDTYIGSDVEADLSAFKVGSTEDGYVPTLVAYDDRVRNGTGDPYYFFGWGAYSVAAFYPTSAPHHSEVAYMGLAFTATGNRVSDFVVMTAHRTSPFGTVDQTDCSVIADRRGLWVQQQLLDGTPKRTAASPLNVPPFDNADCAADTGRPQNFHITGLAGLGSRWLGVSANPMDAGVVLPDDDLVALVDVGNWFDVVEPTSERFPFRGCVAFYDSRCVPDIFAFPPEYPVRATTVLGPCKVCAGGELVAMSVMPASTQSPEVHLEVRCRSASPDGGATLDAILDVTPALASGAACVRTPIPLASSLGTDAVAISRSNAAAYAFAGPRGHLWVGRSSATASPVFLDEAPFGAVTDGLGQPVFLGADRIGWNAGAPLGIIAFPLQPSDGDRPVAIIEGDRKAMVTGGRGIVTLDQVAAGDAPRVLASPDGTPTRFEPPYRAVKAVRADGSEVVIVTAGDVLLAANLGLSKPVLERRLVPAEGKDVIALLALPRSGPGPVEAFALTNDALFKITSDTPQLWAAVQAPLPPGEPIELWADGRRGRIGYRDGQVFSLETRVKIGASLGKRVDDFAQVCGQVYALAEGALHRLTATGGAVGAWQPVALAGGPPAAELEKGTILPFAEADGGTSLYVFSRRGEAVRAPVTACPQ